MWSPRKILEVGKRNLTKTRGDQEVIEQLRALGADLNQPREVIHYLYLPGEEASHLAGEALQSKGYSIEETAAANAGENSQNPFLVKATSQSVLNSKTVHESRRLFEQLAAFHHGEYDGWEAAAKP
jgi:regulator of RNase E activity RraB